MRVLHCFPIMQNVQLTVASGNKNSGLVGHQLNEASFILLSGISLYRIFDLYDEFLRVFFVLVFHRY